MKSFGQKFVDGLVAPTTRRVRAKLRLGTTIGAVQELAVQESAAYVMANMRTALAFDDRLDLLRFAAAKRPDHGLVMEFGVFQGETVNLLADLTEKPVYGFDSFEGLKEDWSGNIAYPRGTFDLAGRLPKVKPNVTLVPGWFDATLPGFLATHTETVSFIHIDCDTYEATKTVLELIGSRLVSGSIVVFDEYFGYFGWRNGEYKAWSEFVVRGAKTYEYIGFSNSQVAVRVTN